MGKTRLVLAALGLAFAANGAGADVIERACIQADRKAASRPLCNCVQQVADITLSSKDQRLASTFFKDPHRAQEVRQSDSKSMESFWKRYKEFGASAERYCAAIQRRS